MSRAGTSKGLDPLERRATVEVVAGLLRDRIIDGTFRSGDQLGEVQLAAQLGVSRGPVREALQRLIQEGLLVARPHRGVFVVELDEQDVIDLYRARATVEQAAAALLAGGDVEPDLGPLASVLEDMTAAAARDHWAAVAKLDRDFHQALVDAAGSRRLSRMFTTLMAEMAMCMGALDSAYPLRQDLVAEHAALLAALRAGDAASFATLLAEHLDQAVTHLRARLAGGHPAGSPT